MTHRWHFIVSRSMCAKVNKIFGRTNLMQFINMFIYIVMPMIVDRRAEVEILQQDLQGRAYDMEYAIG